MPQLLEFCVKGEIAVLSYRVFDKFHNELGIHDGIPEFVEVILVPGHFKDSLEGISNCI